ncbi:MAG: glycine zipper 2TM domain-containing protein [Campylobacteraceae bacterium]|nr:glycine zipper 2TM domain-containing protein [Campylobacteraceae bacterium]
MNKLYFSSFIIFCSAVLCAESITFQEEVRVITSKPEYRMVTTRVPFQECWDEQIEVRYQPQPSNDGSSGVAGAVIGGIAGGILGHQVGGGSGKTAATVGGAVIGTLVGKNIGEQNSNNYAPAPNYRTERRCTTRYEEKSSEKFIGYKNIANYKNQTIIKYSDQPLEFIRLNINVSY